MHRLLCPFLSSKPVDVSYCLSLDTQHLLQQFSRPSYPQGPSTHRASDTASGQFECGGTAWGESRLLRLWLNWNLPLVELVPGAECSKENRDQAVTSTLQHIRQPAPMGSSAQQKDHNCLCWVSAECAQKGFGPARPGPPSLGAWAVTLPCSH